MTAFADLEQGPDGLVPAVVQDADTGGVLMVAWMNQEAYDLTTTSGQAHFWSRSRNELWRKGSTSGNTLTVVAVTPDCDADVVLVTARPDGPACHTGAESCFVGAPDGLAEVGRLWKTIRSRKADRPEGSYTTALLEQGVDGPARKLLEEAGELAFAAKDHAGGTGARERVIEEGADLVYHLLVVLAERDVSLEEVAAELTRRR
ncbi:MAG: bifunctional phosphoribosyl-AMP cyclohydrolase/phosphoribosyl-ATP diphosphatase HisIE [Acidimicrobiia bacterium]|nr:bifunctional phosphoribosyl-AMP cyclohydrolase/phosphoribosyl-ATP diphosphatase HisIE [Acidimicrobiia bacterium]